MDVAITGASGLLGSALAAALERNGDQVLRISRGTRPGGLRWDPEAGRLDPTPLEGIDAVVHFAGHPIGRPHWTAGHKRNVEQSRVLGTQLLARTIAGLSTPPRILVSGSAVGWYGSRGDEVLTEASSRGAGFLSDVCEHWENATQDAEDAGIPVAHIRTGIVVSAKEGAFGPLQLLFKLGLGGRFGDGRQFWPTISLADHVRAVRFLLEGSVTGPVNLTGPEPIRVKDMAAELGRQLHRPAVLPAPAFAIKLGVGREMAEQMILVSQRAVPQRLLDAGFAFEHATFAEQFANRS